MPYKRWLISKEIDLLFIFLPIWVVLVYCFSLPLEVISYKLPITMWVIFILGIDVAHVWSTIFRTYLDTDERKHSKKLLWFAPLFAIVTATTLSFLSEYVFWSVLAYFALFHFIKQQYGIFSMYKRKTHFDDKKLVIKSKWILLLGVLYPVIFWHLSGNRTFYWFEGGNFMCLPAQSNLELVLHVCSILFVLFHFIWLTELLIKVKKIPYGLVLWVLTSSLVWFLGIVWFNSDVVFSLTNVVAHGVPYMVLVFFYVEKKKTLLNSTTFRLSIRTMKNIVLMLVVILCLALVEEYLWDWLINNDKRSFFTAYFGLPTKFELPIYARYLIIGVLSIPQITHYILDGYIWKGGKKNPYIKPVFF